MDQTAAEINRKAALQCAGIPASCPMKADLQSLCNTEAT